VNKVAQHLTRIAEEGTQVFAAPSITRVKSSPNGVTTTNPTNGVACGGSVRGIKGVGQGQTQQPGFDGICF
jgi:hypothetical protein